ncbi:phage major capsid protein [Ketogulonicigenium vulgare]|uniref:phage major capsid protein n=1 Tax=Ketogulonicigenium vulgare TaxID=92945 RepID=UPI00235A3D3E|nr:phage major capsid protein [Ketogulonicigenium vulgare]
MTIEIKAALEASNALIANIRSEVDSVKNADVLHETKMAKMEADLADTLSQKSALETRLTALETANARPRLAGKSDEQVDEYKSAFMDYLRSPESIEAKSALQLAAKSVNIGTGANGGFAVPAFIAAEIAAVEVATSPIRNLSRVVTVSGSDYRELLSNSNAGTGWAGEATARATTATPTFTEVRPTFGEVYATAEISNHALNDIFFNVEAWLIDELARKFAATEGAAFINGDGSDKPTGLLTGTTLTTVKTGAAATLGANPFDALIELQYGVQGGYRQNGSWVMNSTTLAALAKVKDSQGNYIYQPAIAQGVAETLLGKGVYVDENMPLIASGAKPIIFGDFNRGYLIADINGMQVIPDLVTNKGFLTLYASKRVGGVVKDKNALKALVCAA